MVTGGGGGIGAATARLFAEHGAHVVIADIDSELAERTADEITTSGGSALAVVIDIREPDQVTGHTIPTDGGTGAAGGWFRSSRRTDREWTNRPVAP